MIEQAARIVARQGTRARVEVVRQASCGGCRQSAGCSTSVLGQWLLRRRRAFEVDNHLDADIGDEVILGVEEQVLQGMALYVFLLPLGGMILGATVGAEIGALFAADLAEPLSIVAGLVGLIAGIRFVRVGVDRKYRHEAAAPVLLRRSAPGTVALTDPRP